MPAYNAEATLERTIADLPLEWVDEVIIVDDASHDRTVARAHEIVKASHRFTLSPEDQQQDPTRILFSIIRHPENRGYGANQKTCYTTALAHGADIIVMVHPDYQYDARLVKYFVDFMADGYFDVMLGSRIRSRKEALAGGMPLYKYVANRFLTLIQNIATGRSLGEWHTGMRAYKREILESIEYEQFSDDFVFDTQVLFAIVGKGYAVGDIPVPVRYFKEASSINFSRSLRYGILTVWETIKYVAVHSSDLLRYIISGGLAVLSNLSVYGMLLSAGLHFGPAAFIGFWSGAAVSFTLHKYWTFKRTSPRKLPREIVWYVLFIGVNACMNAGILFILVHSVMLHPFIANVISNVLVALWSFVMHKHVTFRRSVIEPGQ